MNDEPCQAEPVTRCDHICLKDDGHVERGEPHFYGYENPSPRNNAAAMFDAIETGRQWETTARWLAEHYEADIRYAERVYGPQEWRGLAPDGALAAFRDVADRTPTPMDGA